MIMWKQFFISSIFKYIHFHRIPKTTFFVGGAMETNFVGWGRVAPIHVYITYVYFLYIHHTCYNESTLLSVHQLSHQQHAVRSGNMPCVADVRVGRLCGLVHLPSPPRQLAWTMEGTTAACTHQIYCSHGRVKFTLLSEGKMHYSLT